MGRRFRRIPGLVSSALLACVAVQFHIGLAHARGPEAEWSSGSQSIADATAMEAQIPLIRAPEHERRGLGPASPTVPRSEQGLGANPSQMKGDVSIFRSIASLFLVILMVLGLAWCVRRGARAKGGIRASLGPGGSSPAGVLRVLGRYPIARGQNLVLLQMDQSVLLISQTTGRAGPRLSTLSEVTDPDRVASLLLKAREAEGETVSHKFKQLMDRFNHEPSDQAITVVPPVGRADWFERRETRVANVSRAPSGVSSAQSETRATEDAVAALKRRLEAMRQGFEVRA